MLSAAADNFVTNILPILVFAIGFLSLLIALPPIFRDRSRRHRQEQDRIALIDQVTARVMGRPENRARGEEEIIGFVKIIPEVQRRVDELTEEIGDRAELQDTNLVDLFQDIQKDVREMRRQQQQIRRERREDNRG